MRALEAGARRKIFDETFRHRKERERERETRPRLDIAAIRAKTRGDKKRKKEEEEEEEAEEEEEEKSHFSSIPSRPRRAGRESGLEWLSSGRMRDHAFTARVHVHRYVCAYDC